MVEPTHVTVASDLTPLTRRYSGVGGWLRVIARLDPFTYAVHALRVLLLKGASVSMLLPDLLFLAGFAAVMVTGAVVLFRRTL
jgi:ABC-type multidrug transport system permease subunit